MPDQLQSALAAGEAASDLELVFPRHRSRRRRAAARKVVLEDDDDDEEDDGGGGATHGQRRPQGAAAAVEKGLPGARGEAAAEGRALGGTRGFALRRIEAVRAADTARNLGIDVAEWVNPVDERAWNRGDFLSPSASVSLETARPFNGVDRPKSHQSFLAVNAGLSPFGHVEYCIVDASIMVQFPFADRVPVMRKSQEFVMQGQKYENTKRKVA
ncbi:MAG: hypothetical protein BJ554DRAFT_3671, partial [Olpidium bornovanus]